jgi:hypothetical protein
VRGSRSDQSRGREHGHNGRCSAGADECHGVPPRIGRRGV